MIMLYASLLRLPPGLLTLFPEGCSSVSHAPCIAGEKAGAMGESDDCCSHLPMFASGVGCKTLAVGVGAGHKRLVHLAVNLAKAEE